MELIGRAAELAAIRDGLGRSRLVTVTGPPGIGKSALASAIVADCETRSLVVPLGGVSEGDELVLRVAAVLETPLDPRASRDAWIDQIGRALDARGRALLSLDGFEALAAAASEIVVRWLSVAPVLSILVTSRHALGVREEQRIDVGPLDALAALELFAVRARAVRSGWNEDGTSRAMATNLVERLDFIPLAIEMAAARVDIASVAWLARRVEERFDVLDGAIDASLETLDDGDAQLLCLCCAFAGAFDAATLEALEKGGDADLLEALARLRAKSLLAIATEGASVRFQILRPIREATARRWPDRVRAAAERHARHWARFVESLGDDLGRLFDADVIEQLHQARLEIAAAERRLDEIDGDTLATCRVLLGLAALQVVRSTAPRIADSLLRRRSASAADRGQSTLAAELELLRVVLHRSTTGDTRDLDDFAARTDDAAFHAALSLFRGLWQAEQGDLDAAVRLLGDAHRFFVSRHPRSWFRVATQGFLWRAEVARGTAALEGAREMQRVIELCRSLGDRSTEALLRTSLGYVLMDHGDLGRARVVIDEALEQSRACGNLRSLALSAAASVELAAIERRVEEAEIVETASLMERVGHPNALLVRAHLADKAYLEGRLEDAVDRFEVLLAHAEAPLARAILHGRLAMMAAARGRLEDAAWHRARAVAESSDAVAVELAGVLPVVDGFVAIAEALRARAAGDPETYLDRRDRAARVLAAGERRTPAARLARVLLDEELRRLDATDVATLTIGPECRWFEADRDPRADVSRRKPLRRVLAALVAQHLEDPSRGVSTERLFAAGWPGERAAARSAATRVWNAIRQLRRLGLERLLTRRGEGYGFTERLRIERATE